MSKYKYICGMFTDDEDGYTIDCDDMAEEYNKLAKEIAELKAKNQQLQQQLKDNTKQVCERIIDIINKEFNCCGYIEDIEFDEFKQKLLDQIEKGENDEKTTYK